MDFFQIVTLALVQGLTEFLPISSSAHLILIPKLTHWQDQGLVFDVALHVGSLFAVVGYFRKDILSLSVSGLNAIINRRLSVQSKLFFAIGFGTVPVGLAGLMLHDWIELSLRSVLVIAISSIFFGLFLLLAEKVGHKKRDELDLKWHDVLLIGVAQALALIPGTSRSGVTITAGLFLGLNRQAAARFSFLLSIPVIFLGGGLKAIELMRGDIVADIELMLLAIGISATSAFFCIHLFLKLIDKIGMLPFVLYRIILGLLLLWIYATA